MNTRRAWTVALVTIFAGVALGLVQYKVAPCMTTLMNAFSIDMATAGWLSSLFSLVGIVVALPASIILKRFGPKQGGLFALLCAIAGSLIGVFAQNAAVLMASRVVEGIGVGLIAVIGPTLIAMWFPEAKRGLPMSIWGAYQMGAQAVMFFLGGVLTTGFGWQGMWWFALAVCVVSLVFYLLCVKSPRPTESHANVESEEVSLLKGIKSPSTWMISLATMLFSVGCFGFVNWIATCWVQIYGWSEGEANMWVGFFSIGGVVAAVVIGALLNRVSNRRRFGVVALIVYGVV
jgi:predicted MFS family arabinose efflux permease